MHRTGIYAFCPRGNASPTPSVFAPDVEDSRLADDPTTRGGGVLCWEATNTYDPLVEFPVEECAPAAFFVVVGVVVVAFVVDGAVVVVV